jgi:3-mercaptopyruvate sulfurtransferase SseA
MPKRKLVLSISVLLLAMLACNYVAPTEQSPLPVTVIVEPTSATRPGNIPLTEADVPRVSLEEAKLALESGNAVVVDVRSAEAYQASHIAGAISIPLGTIETDPTSIGLDKERWIITYCT